MSASDFVDLALRSTRDEFVATWPCAFLVGNLSLPRPRSVHHTLEFPADNATAAVPALGDEDDLAPPLRSGLVAFPVRKVQDQFAHMITVGRTANNDIAIPSLQISKFHAFFREEADGQLLLADAGSRNGTFIQNAQLPTRGKPQSVARGAAVAFGKIHFLLVDAAGCWDFLRREKSLAR